YKVIDGYDFYNHDSDPMDDNGHGTHVAGVIAGSGGMTGVAPGASILAYKALGPDGSGSMSDVIVAIDRAIDPNQDGDTSDHADVISMSLGGKGQSDDPVCQAVENAVSAGVVVVVAAGNDGPSIGTVSSPGLAPDAITVGAVDNNGALASFSSRGTSPDLTIKPEISAPGANINSTVPFSNAAHSSSTGYAVMSGTSMATPHVSGGAALLLQMHPTWTPAQVKSALISGAAELNESVWSAGAGGLWIPTALDSSLFFSTSMVSYGLAGSASRSVTVTNLGSSVSLSLSSRDCFGLSADGKSVSAVWTNTSIVSPTSGWAQSGGSVSVALSVLSPSSDMPEGYYDGQVTVSGGSVQARMPFGFAVLSRLNVHVIDLAGREVSDPYGGVWVYQDPTVSVSVGVRGSVDKPAPPASFLLPSGDYSAHSFGHQLLYEFSDPYALSAKFSLGRLETKDLYLNMSAAHAFTIDLATDDGLPIFVKDYRVYGRHVGENNISFHLVGSDYSIKGSDIFTLPTSKTVYISDTDITVGIAISGFSYTAAMWDFMQRNWQHWYEYADSNSNEFYQESSADLQYLLAWEFHGIDSSTSTHLGLVPGQYSAYDTKYDIPGQLEDIWGDWGNHRSIGGDATFYIRRDTDTSLNSFFSGMTRRTIVQGVFTEVYFPGDLFQGFLEREYYTPDYSHLVRANLASEVYLPDRNFLTSIDGVSATQRVGAGPFYPAILTANTADSMVMYEPMIKDQSGAKVGGMALPSMTLYRNGQLSGVYQIAEHLSRPDAMRIIQLSVAGTYTASIEYSPVPQICNNV
ncbi:MAG: S8 family serine peptidase, partial [Candidatus Thermoplasmatota archaeon]|nr:S8 family serine peptidase [Candidatus Thermoplasmatota archaeon]